MAWSVPSFSSPSQVVDQATVSTHDDIQISTFSDGSHSRENHGGVGMAYKRRWLPKEWTHETADPASDCVDMVEQAWAYGYAVGAMTMEGVGVLESLYAANDEITRHLAILQKHASTVKVRITTDCQPILEQIARSTEMIERKEKFMPPELCNRMKEMIVTLQGHGIQVVVEMHWSPRNAVLQLWRADQLAGRAMRTGLGYSKETSWSEAIVSVIMKQLVPKLPGSISYTRSVPATSEAEGTRKEGRRRKKNGKRKPEGEMQEGKPAKKARTSNRPRTMPTSWGMDPETKVHTWILKRGEQQLAPVVCCPIIREVEVCTMQTRGKNVFVNDGLSGSSMGDLTAAKQTTRPAAAVSSAVYKGAVRKGDVPQNIISLEMITPGRSRMFVRAAHATLERGTAGEQCPLSIKTAKGSGE